MQEDFRQIWPLFLLPKEDELLTSWMIRTAHNHEQKVYTFYRKHLKILNKGNKKLWIIDLDRNANKDVIEIMSLHTGLTEEFVRSTTLQYYEGRLFETMVLSGNTQWLLPKSNSKTEYQRNGILYCSGCLSKDQIPYFRKKWRLSVSFCCPECGFYLRETCHECGSEINYIRTELGRKNEYNLNVIVHCHSCNADLRYARAPKCDEQDLTIQRRIYKYIEDGHTERLNYSHLYFDVLAQVCSMMLTNSRRYIDLQKKVARECNIKYKPMQDGQRNKVDCIETRLRRDIIIMATWLLENWPKRFLQVMAETGSGTTVQFHNTNKKELLPFWYASVNCAMPPLLKSGRITRFR